MKIIKNQKGRAIILAVLALQTAAAFGGTKPLLISVSEGTTVQAGDRVQAAYSPPRQCLDVVYTATDTNGVHSVWVATITTNGLQANVRLGDSYAQPTVSIAQNPTNSRPGVGYRAADGRLVFSQNTADGTWTNQATTFTAYEGYSLGFDPISAAPVVALNTTGDWNLCKVQFASGNWLPSVLSWSDACWQALLFNPGKVLCISFVTYSWTAHPSTLRYWQNGIGETIVDAGADWVGTGNSLAFDNLGAANISYFNSTQRQLKHAWFNGTWQKETVAEGAAGVTTSLVINSSNRMYVSYVNTAGSTNALTLLEYDGTTWHSQTLLAARDLAAWSSLVLGWQETPLLAFIARSNIWVAEPHAIQLPTPQTIVPPERVVRFLKSSGVNPPWWHYGFDLGQDPYSSPPRGSGYAANRQTLEADFSFMATNGVRLARVFLFADARSGFIYSNGVPIAFDQYVFEDMDTLVDVARQYGVKLLPVPFDYMLADGVTTQGGASVGERPEFISNPLVRSNLLSLLETFVTRYATNDIIYGWDIMNEPEFATAVTVVQMREFMELCVAVIRRVVPGARVMFGTTAIRGMTSYGEGVCTHDEIHLYGSDASVYESPAAEISTNKAVLIGEVAPADVARCLDLALANGYEGVLFWAMNASGGLNFRDVATVYKNWVTAKLSELHARASVKQFSVAGNEVRLRFDPAVVGLRYVVEVTDTLGSTANWGPTSVSLTPTTNGPVSFVLPRTNGQAFYRVRVNL